MVICCCSYLASSFIYIINSRLTREGERERGRWMAPINLTASGVYFMTLRWLADCVFAAFPSFPPHFPTFSSTISSSLSLGQFKLRAALNRSYLSTIKAILSHSPCQSPRTPSLMPSPTQPPPFVGLRYWQKNRLNKSSKVLPVPGRHAIQQYMAHIYINTQKKLIFKLFYLIFENYAYIQITTIG